MQYCGEFDNWGAVMSVSSNLLCSFELLKPLDSSALKNHIKRGRNARQNMLNSPVSCNCRVLCVERRLTRFHSLHKYRHKAFRDCFHYEAVRIDNIGIPGSTQHKHLEREPTLLNSVCPNHADLGARYNGVLPRDDLLYSPECSLGAGIVSVVTFTKHRQYETNSHTFPYANGI